MNDQERMLKWLKTQHPVPTLAFIVGGQPSRRATEYKAFVCLYPYEPRLRIFNNGIMPDAELQQRIAGCDLPDGAEGEYLKGIRRNTRGMGSQEELNEIAAELARKHQLPLGCYSVGVTAQKERKYVLWVSSLLSPTYFLRELKQAAQS